MRKNDVPPTLAKHFAFIFSHARNLNRSFFCSFERHWKSWKDPILLFSGKVKCDDTIDTTLFENINTSVWQTLRLKPPNPENDCWWRVEFRFYYSDNSYYKYNKILFQVNECTTNRFRKCCFFSFRRSFGSRDSQVSLKDNFFYVTEIFRFQLNLTIPMSLALENYNRCIARDGIFKLYHFKYVEQLNSKKMIYI